MVICAVSELSSYFRECSIVLVIRVIQEVRLTPGWECAEKWTFITAVLSRDSRYARGVEV